MTAAEIVAQIKPLGLDSYRKVILTQGVQEPCFGVKIEPYLVNPLLCVSGGTTFARTTFANSYAISDVVSSPYCQRVPQLHKLPP